MMRKKQPPERRRAFSVPELAIAWNIHQETVRRRIRNGTLAAFKIGDEWRIPLAAVEAFERDNPEGSTCFARPAGRAS